MVSCVELSCSTNFTKTEYVQHKEIAFLQIRNLPELLRNGNLSVRLSRLKQRGTAKRSGHINMNPKKTSACLKTLRVFHLFSFARLKFLGLARIKHVFSCGIFCHQELEISQEILF